MDISQMKNIVVLKDLPSNLVDEAIVILKNNSTIKKKETIDYTSMNKPQEKDRDNCDVVIKEAEQVVQEYIKSIEKNNEARKNINKMTLKYRRLQMYSLIFCIVAIISICMSIIK